MKRPFTVRCLTEKRAKYFPRQSFTKVNTEPDVYTHALGRTHTNYNAAPRGLGRPAVSILFPLNGSCVTKDNLASLRPGYLRGIWMPLRLACGLRFFFFCFVLFLGNVFYSRFLFSSSPPLWLLPFPLSPLLEWSAEGVLGTWLDAPLTALHLNSPTSSPQDPLCDTEAGDCGTCPCWHSITLMQDAHCFTVYRAATKNNKLESPSGCRWVCRKTRKKKFSRDVNDFNITASNGVMMITAPYGWLTTSSSLLSFIGRNSFYSH